MKTILSLTFLALFFSGTLWTDGHESSAPTIAVTGHASIEVTPDQMAWHIRISVEGKEPLELKSENDRASNSVLKILEQHNIRKETIQTSGLSFQKLWRKDKSKAYSCENHIRFILEDLNAYPELMEAIIQIPYVFLSSTGFRYSKHEEVLKEAREKALINAKEKAAQMLNVYAMRLGDPIRINDPSSPQHSSRMQYAELSATKSGGSPLREGTLKITHTVSVQFEIEPSEESDPRESIKQ